MCWVDARERLPEEPMKTSSLAREFPHAADVTLNCHSIEEKEDHIMSNTLPFIGTRVRTRSTIKPVEELAGMCVLLGYKLARRTDTEGIYRGIVPGHGGDVWYVEHKNVHGAVQMAVYVPTELIVERWDGAIPEQHELEGKKISASVTDDFEQNRTPRDIMDHLHFVALAPGEYLLRSSDGRFKIDLTSADLSPEEAEGMRELVECWNEQAEQVAREKRTSSHGETIRVLRVLEYQGPRELVEACIEKSIHGTKVVGSGTDKEYRISASTVGVVADRVPYKLTREEL